MSWAIQLFQCILLWPYVSVDLMKVGHRNGIASASERCLSWRQPHLPTLERPALQRSAHRLQTRRMRLAEPVKPACTARAQPVASTPTSSRRTGTELAPPFRVVITGGTKGKTSSLLISSEKPETLLQDPLPTDLASLSLKFLATLLFHFISTPLQRALLSTVIRVVTARSCA